MLTVGHTDDRGSEASNDALSERRATSALAVLRGNIDVWEDNYRTERAKAWPEGDFHTMLLETRGTAPTAAEIRQHMEVTSAGRARRAALFAQYFERLLGIPPASITVPTLTPEILACGERHALVTGDDPDSRRAEFFFFRGTTSPIIDCDEYPGWLTDCRTLPGGPPTVDIAPIDTVRLGTTELVQVTVSPSPLPLGATVTLELSTTSGNGEARFDDTGTSTMQISGSQAVRVRGTALSSAADNIRMQARFTGQTQVLDHEEFTVVLTFFVSDAGNDVTGDGSLTKPWRTITHALDERLPLVGPVTIGVLQGTFQENVFLPSQTTLEGMNDPLPIVSGTAASKPTIEVNGGRNIKIRKLRVRNGTESGIRLRNATDIEIGECEVLENSGPRGGGIAVIDSEIIAIEGNEIALNEAGTIATAVVRLVLDASLLPLEITAFEIEIGDAHGGGVYVENSGDVEIKENQIHDNTAILFGGGIAVDNRPGFDEAIEISQNQIFCNQVSHGDLSDLEAPEFDCSKEDLEDPLLDRMEEETLDAAAAEAVRLLHGAGVESGLGGGIALRHVSPQTRLIRNLIGARREGDVTQRAPNRARRGGGIECYIGAYPRIEENTVAFNLTSDDGGGIAIDEFDPFLPDNQPQFFGFRRAALIPRQRINLVNNRIRFNRTLEDGGGIYATGNPQVSITGSRTLIEGNRAQENGGGIRVSYAARLTMRGARIVENQANTDEDGREGGGGLAARNAAVSLQDCEFEGNVANMFAGGAIFCNSAFEGGFNAAGFIPNQAGQFDRIMERDYGFSTRICTLNDCRGSGNQATGEAGAGGYLYAVHVEGDQPLHVALEGASTAIGENRSEYDRQNRRKRGNVVVEFSGQMNAAGLPTDEVTIHGDVPAPPTGIANSTPTPDNRPVVIIHGGTRPDDHPTSFPFANRPPRIDEIDPPFGAMAGGTLVVVRGSGFLPNLEVTFGTGNRAGTVIFTSSEEISVVTPPVPIPQVLVDLEVRNPDGQADTETDGFEYVDPPMISAIDPLAGPFIGGTEIEIEGSGFRGGLDLFIGDQPAEVIEVQSDRVTAITPPGPVGPADLTVANRDRQSDTVVSGFEYIVPPAPEITSISPREGPVPGGTVVTIEGLNFLPGAQVFFGGEPATTVIFNGERELEAVTPGGSPGLVDVSVVNPDRQASNLGDFTYLPPPRISDIQPRSGPAGASTPVVVTGTDIHSGASLTVEGATVSSVLVVSSTELNAVIEGGSVGDADVTVTNPDGQSDSVDGGFRFE